MLRRYLLSLVFLITLLPLEAKPAKGTIAYTLRFPEATAHYMDVEMEVPSKGKKSLEIFMSVWTPGSYLVREYARNVISLDAVDDKGRVLDVVKTSKNRWRIDTQGSAVTHVSYRLFCREINVRGNWVESDFAVINGAPTFMSVVDEHQRPYSVEVELPSDWKRSSSALASGEAPNQYSAADFDTLMDSPLVIGDPQVDRFEVDGIPHYLVTLGGGGVWENARAARNVQHLVEAQRDFWGELPYDEPYYFFNLLTGSRGGLEHKQSLMITADRWYSASRGGIRSWLSLVSHEFFHVWNGKRLRPVELGPFEYEHENYSPSLWVVEGITSYYQHVLLARAGYTKHDQYLRSLSGSIAATERTPGRLVQSLSASSFDAWIKAYRRDENSVNALFSYYGGGAVAGFLIDAKIQRTSGGERSLDDVLRTAYDRYSEERGYTESEFINLASEVAGQDLSEWFQGLVREPNPFDYMEALDWFGLEFEAPDESKSAAYFPVPDEPEDRPKGWLGADTKADGGLLKVTTVASDTPAAAAGLSADDEIIAIDGHRVDSGKLKRIVGALGAGTTVEILIARQGLLRTVEATLGEERTETWQLKFRGDQTDEQKARVEKWLGVEPVE